VQAREAGDGTYAFKYVMIDKSKAEMSAVASTLGSKYLLCYFHLLQDWERFLRSSDSGVRTAEDRHSIMISLAHLQHMGNEAIFNQEVGLCRRNASLAVLKQHVCNKKRGTQRPAWC
jgi:hypothetical protein